jgi:hypothetical protein
MSVNRRWLCVTGALALVLGFAAHPGAAAPEGGQLKVTVKYKGAGKVDAAHQVIVWAFSTPQIDASSIPVATQSVTSDGGSASFTGLPKVVYLAAAFNEKGDYDGTSGPPPSGTPVVIYGDGGTAKAVDTGAPDAAVTITFDDSVRMP